MSVSAVVVWDAPPYGVIFLSLSHTHWIEPTGSLYIIVVDPRSESEVRASPVWILFLRWSEKERWFSKDERGRERHLVAAH